MQITSISSFKNNFPAFTAESKLFWMEKFNKNAEIALRKSVAVPFVKKYMRFIQFFMIPTKSYK